MNMEPVRFGVIGCGLMGREFASVSMRWLHLACELARPVIVAACDLSPKNLDWFRQVPDTKYFYSDYHELLANPEVEAVYCAVPHHLHAQVYGDVIRAGKHLIGEKPFGMDLPHRRYSPHPSRSCIPASPDRQDVHNSSRSRRSR